MLLISKILVSIVALVPLFAFAQVLSPDPELPKAIRYSQEYNIKIIEDVFGDKASEAIKIAKCESGFNNTAVGDGGYSSGLFQIYTKVHQTYTIEELKDPYLNTVVARRIFDKSGWLPWTCRNVLL